MSTTLKTALTLTAGLAIPALAQDGLPLSQPAIREALRQVNPGGGFADSGADVIIGELHANQNGTNNSMTLTISPAASTATHLAYGLGTTSCNVGTVPLNWRTNTPDHPIMPQNLYRLTPGPNSKFIQLGQSWAKFAFAPLQFSNCSNEGYFCSNPMNNTVLGVGCSDVYTTFTNSQQSGLGPRFTVDPFSGVIPDGDSAWRNANWLPAVSTPMDRRLQVAKADIDAGGGGLFFGESIHVARDDALAGNGKNNASYRRCTFDTTYILTFTDSTARRSPAIYAWQAHGLGLGVPDTSIMITEVNTLSGSPPDGWFLIGSHAVQTGPSTWHYEYAIENLNSDRMGGSFTIPFLPGTLITNAAWRGIDSHSGIPSEDATRNQPWVISIMSNFVRFQAPAAFNFNTPTLGNGLRWGTLYNFSFDCNRSPVSGIATFSLFKPGDPTIIPAAAWIPNQSPSACYANCDGSTGTPALTSNDFQCFVDKFAASDPYANCDGSTGTPALTSNDFQCFVNKFAGGCT